MNRLRRLFNLLLPRGSRRRILAGRIKLLMLRGTLGPDFHYRVWVKKYESLTLSPIMGDQGIRISIIVPAYNTPRKYIEPLIESVMSQTYTNWQLCVADGSTDAAAKDIIRNLCAADQRIKYISLKKNLGISGNTNQAFSFVEGDYIAFLDHDDILPAWSLNEAAAAIKQNPKADIFYSDEDRLTENGRTRMSPFFKPDWSPDLFMSANYMAHFFVIKKDLFRELKSLRSEYDGSQDYDFCLRALDHNPQIVHIPKILYHMRMAHGSTAKEIGEKNYADEAGRAAINDYFKRNKIQAEALEVPERPTNHRIKYKIAGSPIVSIIIPFRDKVELLQDCLGSIMEKSTYDNYELILISNNSKERETFDYLSSLQNKRIRIIEYNKPFNYSKLNNLGRRQARGKFLIFLNNDTKVISPQWIEELISVAAQPEVGAVGPLLMYSDSTIQHAGVILGMTGMAGHIFRNLKLGMLTPFWLPDWPRNYLAVTGACLAVETEKFDKIKGFDEKFIMAGSDVVLGLDLYEKGYRNVYWPYAMLFHYESKSVISYKNAPESDYNNSLKRYRPYLNYGDIYFNPNLNLESEIPSLRNSYDQ